MLKFRRSLLGYHCCFGDDVTFSLLPFAIQFIRLLDLVTNWALWTFNRQCNRLYPTLLADFAVRALGMNCLPEGFGLNQEHMPGLPVPLPWLAIRLISFILAY